MTEKLIARLEGLRQTGPGRWIARCPAHDDRSPSLSVKELDDGRTLVHCFAGCDPLSVVQAVGLEMTDLFPERLAHHLKSTGSPIPASDRLELIDHEATTVGLIAGKFIESRALDESEWERLAVAVSRIGKVKCHG